MTQTQQIDERSSRRHRSVCSPLQAGLVDGPSPLARPVIVHGNQEPVGLFFGQ